ncbi:dynamin family protein [Dactylosporangium sp. CS-047395]|uniref:dynamin family protein n=1 Tax=Dactylosporangium sp. CS-047395 TaxID=3239936 RepID=UPI003D8AD474
MRDFDTARDAALSLFPQLIALAERRGARTAAGRLAAARERLADGRLTVVVCGEFKRGKSSLLNALLDEHERPLLFPEAGEIATSVVTTVRYGEQERIEILLELDGGGTETVEAGRAELAGYVTESGNPHNARRARLVAIETPHPKLRSGLTLVDTPGVGGVYAGHTAATMAFLPSADAIVFVFDATQPLLESELRFLRHAAEAVAAGDSRDALQFVLTKTDIGDYSAILANGRAKIATALGRPADQVTIVPVSAHAKRDYLLDGDDEDLELSNFPALEAALWGSLHRYRAKRLLGAALDELGRAAQGLLEPLKEELDALADETNVKLAGLVAEAQGRQKQLAEMRTASAKWRRQLADELGGLGRRLGVQGERRLDQVWHGFSVDYLRDDQYLYHPERLVGQLTADAAQVVGELNEQAAVAAAEVLADFSLRHGFDLDRPALGELPVPPVPELRVDAEPAAEDRPGLFRGRLGGLRAGVSLGAAVGGLLGGLIVPVVGNAVGAAIGGLLGSALGWQEGLADERRADRQARRQSLQQQLGTLQRDQRRHVSTAVNEVVRDFTTAAIAELDGRLAQQEETLQDLLPRLAAARKATHDAAKARSRELLAECKPLIELRERVTALAAAAAKLSTVDAEAADA